MRLTWFAVNASYAHSSLALPLAHLAARDCADWEWQAIAAQNTDDPGELAMRLADSQPDMLCATLYLFNRQLVINVLQRVKALCPHCLIAVGGPECSGTGADELLKRYSQLDFALDGEAEAALPPMLNAIRSGATTFTGINGLAWRQSPQQLVRNPGKAFFSDWANAPTPLLSPFFDGSKPFVQVETARGCRQGCSYCCSCHSTLRYKTLAAVRQELAAIHTRGIRDVRLLDRTFNTPPRRCVDLLRLFREHFPDMHFHLEIHPQLLSPGIRRELLLARPGQLHIEAGIQTLKPAALRAVGRLDQSERALDGLAFLARCQAFATHADLLAGLPEQTYDDVLDDVRQLVAVGPAEIQLETLKMLYGTPLREDAKAAGLLFSPETPYDVMASSWMNARDITHCRRLSRLLDLYYNHPALQQAFRLANTDDGDFLRLFFAFLDQHGLELGPAPDLRKRFALFTSYLNDMQPVSAAMDALAYNWLLWAFTPGEGPAAAAKPAQTIPDHAQCLHGDPQCRPKAGRRLWMLPTQYAVFWFIYDRAIAANRAAAVFVDKIGL